MIVDKRMIKYGVAVPIIFAFLNYVILAIEFNFIELLMVIIITEVTMYIYGKNQDYLDPAVYFPILYFFLYWIGNFDFEFYPSIPKTMWWLYLDGLIGFYLGVLFLRHISIRTMSLQTRDYIRKNPKIFLLLFYFTCVILKFYMYYKSGIPLLNANVDATRQNLAESYGAIKVISSAFTIITVFFWYDLLIYWKNYNKIKILNVLLIVFSFGLATLDVSRLVFIQMLIPMILIYSIKIRRIKLKHILLLVLGVLIFIGLNKFVRNILENPEYLVVIKNERNTNLFQNIMLSSFTSFRVGIDDLRQLIKIVPKYSNYTHGKMFLNSLLTPLPGKQIIMGYYVAELLGMKFDGIGAATTILGMFYLDGGPILIFIGMFLFSIFIEFFYLKYILNRNINIYNLVSIYIIYYAINCLRTNVMPTIEPVLSIFYYVLISYILKKVK